MNKLQNVTVFLKIFFFIRCYTSECTAGSNCLAKDQQCSLPGSVKAQGKRLNCFFKPLTVSQKSAMFAILKLNIWLKNLLFYDFL